MASAAGYSSLPKGMADDEEVEQAAQLRNKLQSGLLRSLARLAERPPTPRSVMLLYLLIDIFQLLIIPLSPSAGMPWGNSPIMGSIYKFLLYINLLPKDGDTMIPGLSVPYTALNLTVTSIILCAIVVSAFLYMWLSDAFAPPDMPQSAWKARAVWYLAPIFLHALLVPMVAGLLAPMSCLSDSSTSWMGSSLTCWSGGHVGLVIAGVTVCLAFLAVMLILAVTIVDRRVEVAGKENPACAVTGRVDAAMVLLRSAFAAFFIFGFSATPWATVIVGIVAGLAYIVAYGMWFPYYRLHVNQSFAIGGSVLLSAGIGAALAVGTASGDQSNGGAILFLFLIVPCAFCAFSALAFRWKSFASMTDLSTPYLVELKSRTLIIDVVEPAMRSQAINRASTGGRHSSISNSNGTFSDTMSMASGKGKSSGASIGGHGGRFSLGRHDRNGGGGDGDDDRSARSGQSEKQPAGNRSRSARSAVSGFTSNNGRGGAIGEGDVESAAAGANGVATVGDALRLIDALYRDATRSMNGSAMLDIFAASYLGGVRNNRHLERLHLKSAQAKAGTWALDVRAFAFMREEAIIAREEDDSSSRMTVQKRIELEELTQLSRQQVNSTRSMVLVFWESLSARHPDLAKLQATGISINRSLGETDATFRRLMVLAPQSPSLLRAYAEFLLELANDSRRGMELLNDAEQIEDEQSRARTAAAKDDTDFLFGAPLAFDLSADSVAMIRVSADPDTVGAVLSINAPAQKLLGFSARELTGRTVDSIIPSPIAELHDGFLHRYLADGREHIVGTSRGLFMQHRNGHIVPARVSIAKSLTGDEWFTCAEEISTNWMFLTVLGEESAWRLTGACKSAMAMMGIEGPAIKSGSVSLQNYVGDIEDLMAQFEVNADKSVLVRLLVADTSASEVSASSSGAAGAGASSSGKYHGHHKSSGRTHAGKGPNGRHGGSKASSSTPSGVLVAARAQSFSMTGMDAPFVILRFRRATDADRSLMPLDAGAPGQLTGLAGEAGARNRGEMRLGRHRDAEHGSGPVGMGDVDGHGSSNKHVSFGERKAWSDRHDDGRDDRDADMDSRSDSDGDGDGDSSRLPSRAPTPPSGGSHTLRSVSGRSSGSQGQGTMTPQTRSNGGVPSGHPRIPSGHASGDISMCPVMGMGGISRASNASTGAGSGRFTGSSGRAALLQTPHPSARPVPSAFSSPTAAAATTDAQTGGATVNLGPVASAAGALDLGADIFGPVSLPGVPTGPGMGMGAAAGSPATSVSAVAAVDAFATPQGLSAFDTMGVALTSGSMSDPSAVAPHAAALSDVSPSEVTAMAGSARGAGGIPKRRLSLSMPGSGASAEEKEKGKDTDKPKRTLTFAKSPGGKLGAGSGTAVGGGAAAVMPAAGAVDDDDRELIDSDRAETADSARNGGDSDSEPLSGAKAGAEPASVTRSGSRKGSGLLYTAVAADGHAAASGAGLGDALAIVPAAADGTAVALRSAMAPGKEVAVAQPIVAGKAGSVHSGSKGSGGSATSMSEILRRGVAAKSKNLEGSLILLRRSIIMAFILIAVASIISLVVTTVLFNQMIQNMSIVRMTGERALALQRIYGDTQSLQLFNANITHLPAGGTLKVATLRTNIDTFEKYHLALYELVDGQVQEEVDLYTLPSAMNVTDLVPGTFVDYGNFSTTTRGLSLMNAGAEIIARGRRVANLPVSSIVESNPDAYFVVMDGYQPIRTAANTSQMLADSRSEQQAATIELANNVVLGVGLGILALIAGLVITPAVFRVLKAKSLIFDIFLAVPLTVTKALRARTAKRVAAAAQEEDGDDVALDLDVDDKDRGDAGEEDEGLAAVAMAANGGAVRLRNDSASVGGESADDNHSRASGAGRRASIGGGELIVAAGSATEGAADGTTAKSTTTSKHKRRYSRAASATGRLLFAMLWPIIFYVAYFVGTYVWRAQTTVLAKHARAEVLWAHQLEFFVRQVNFNARSALAYSAPAFVLDQVSRGVQNLDKVLLETDALLYGDNTFGTRAMLQLYPSVKDLWAKYACFENGGFYYTIAACEAFNDGILAKTGLLGAVQDFTNLVRANLKWAKDHPDESMDLNSGPAQLMQQYGSSYLPPAFSRFSSILTEEPTSQLNQYNTLNLLVTVASIIALLGFYFFVYSPLIRKLDRDIKNVRGLLLIFPDEVSRNTAAIITAGREMLKDSQSVAGTSVASGGSRAVARRR